MVRIKKALPTKTLRGKLRQDRRRSEAASGQKKNSAWSKSMFAARLLHGLLAAYFPYMNPEQPAPRSSASYIAYTATLTAGHFVSSATRLPLLRILVE